MVNLKKQSIKVPKNRKRNRQDTQKQSVINTHSLDLCITSCAPFLSPTANTNTARVFELPLGSAALFVQGVRAAVCMPERLE